jgi:PAS domain S-box-containing protein
VAQRLGTARKLASAVLRTDGMKSPRPELLAATVLAVAVAITVWFWKGAQATLDRELKVYFEFRVRDAESRVTQRMLAYEQVLLGGAGLFAATEHVDRRVFRDYAAALRLEENYPGIQGIGFSLVMRPASKAQHMAAVRREGFPQYAIRPEGERDVYTSIIYLEPFEDRNLRAFGYDMFSEPVRRAAMEAARDSGTLAVSGKVKLVQETEREIQAGFLMYVPVYRNDVAVRTVAERRAHLIGWVYAPFRMNDLMHGIFGERAADLDIDIFDGDRASAATLMYDGRSPHATGRTRSFVTERVLDVAGHRWTMSIRPSPGFEARVPSDTPRLIALGGTIASLLLSALVLLLARGRARALREAAELSREISERRRVEGALRESEALYRSLFTLAPSGVVLMDRDGRLLAFNDQAHEQLGYTRDEFARLTVPELNARDGRETVFARIQDVVDRGHGEFEVVQRSRSGELRDTLVRTRPVELCGKVHLLAVWQDITERKAAEQALRDSEERGVARAAELEAVLEAVPAAVMITHDADARRIESNRFGHETLRVPVDCNMSKAAERDAPTFRVFQNGTELPSSELPLQVAASRGQPVTNAEFEIVFEDGTVHHLLGNARPLLDAHGARRGAVGAFVDVTDLKHAQARLMQADRLASVGMLAAGVAHEINNPLAYVVASLDFVQAEIRPLAENHPGAVSDETLQALAEAREGIARVKHVVRDLKTFSRADDERRFPVELRPVIESSINMAFNEIKYRARLVKDYGKAPPVLANDGRLGQVILNLLVNAAQAIPEGHVDENEIRVTTRTDEAGRAVVEVRDTGPGVPRHALARVFEPFFTTKPSGVGTGLGLSICRNIVTALDGSITVESEPGRGATFRVILPAAPSDAAEVLLPARSAQVPSGRRGRVLVVDDEPGICAALRRVLASEHDVVALTSAREARDRIARGERFDVILTDLMMPGMSGMELHTAVAEIAKDQAERMVLLTGGAFTPGAEEFLNKVPNARVDKPFDPASLRALVRGLVHGCEPRAPARRAG